MAVDEAWQQHVPGQVNHCVGLQVCCLITGQDRADTPSADCDTGSLEHRALWHHGNHPPGVNQQINVIFDLSLGLAHRRSPALKKRSNLAVAGGPGDVCGAV